VGSALGDSELTLKAQVTGRVGYSIGKAALNMVVAKYAAQYKAEGFVFLSINPGSVDTSADAMSERQSPSLSLMPCHPNSKSRLPQHPQELLLRIRHCSRQSPQTYRTSKVVSLLRNRLDCSWKFSTGGLSRRLARSFRNMGQKNSCSDYSN
jgi:hypothetical protein